MNTKPSASLVAEYRATGLDPDLLTLLEDTSEPYDDELRWAVGNPRHPEVIAVIAARTKARKARLARQPKRFIVRKVRTGHGWAVKDQQHPQWVGWRLTFDGVIAMLETIGRNLPAWDGTPRVTARGQGGRGHGSRLL